MLTRRAAQPRLAPGGVWTASYKANLPWCTWGPESGGDYRASNGTHFGKYQFDLRTWRSVGGTGSPLDAPPEEQDYRAALLYAQRGGQPWVNC
ncbi:transglycosylase family protein [Candidatus Solirubrobacter pratensis]|uniref:transglycosylase family protein n=1 Tax=Candidatus Solirubrobacter pratensis TaxID=1298857 RepID=UPI0009DBB456